MGTWGERKRLRGLGGSPHGPPAALCFAGPVQVKGFSERRRRGQRGPGLGGPRQEAGACSLPGGPAWTQLETRSSPGRSQAGLGPGGGTRPRPGCPSAAEEGGLGRGKQSFPRSAERPPRRPRDASAGGRCAHLHLDGCCCSGLGPSAPDPAVSPHEQVEKGPPGSARGCSAVPASPGSLCRDT